jgi:hypothetical protein
MVLEFSTLGKRSRETMHLSFLFTRRINTLDEWDKLDSLLNRSACKLYPRNVNFTQQLFVRVRFLTLKRNTISGRLKDALQGLHVT